MTANHVYVKRSNYSLEGMVTELDSLRTSEDLVDVTLSCDGQLFKAHKVVLSLCSLYFRKLFKDNPCEHPVVILNDVNKDDVKALLDFVYKGTIDIPETKLASFLRIAKLLQIRGFAEDASTINADLESTQTNLEINLAPPLQELSNNINKAEKKDISTSTVKCDSPISPNGVGSTKRKKCLPIKLRKQSDDGTELMDETTGNETDILSQLKVNDIDNGNENTDYNIDGDGSKDYFGDDYYVQEPDGNDYEDVDLDKDVSNSNTLFDKSLSTSYICTSTSSDINFAIASTSTSQCVSDQKLNAAELKMAVLNLDGNLLKDEKLVTNIQNLDNSIVNIETLLESKMCVNYYSLPEEEKIKHDLLNAFALNSLYWMYLKLDGADPTSHKIKQELDRLKTIMDMAKDAMAKKKILRIDKHAAKRFIEHALWTDDCKHRSQNIGKPN